MSHIQVQRQGNLKYSTSNLLNSSDHLGWSTLFAELRSHTRREGAGIAAPRAEVAIALRSSDKVHVTSKIYGTWRSVRPTTGTIWLCPIGAKADEINIGAVEPQDVQLPELQVIHLYVSNSVFAHLADDYSLSAAPGRSIRYSCGVQDAVINQIGVSVLQEDDVTDCRGAHARRHVIVAARGTASPRTLREWVHPTAGSVATSTG